MTAQQAKRAAEILRQVAPRYSHADRRACLAAVQELEHYARPAVELCEATAEVGEQTLRCQLRGGHDGQHRHEFAYAQAGQVCSYSWHDGAGTDALAKATAVWEDPR